MQRYYNIFIYANFQPRLSQNPAQISQDCSLDLHFLSTTPLFAADHIRLVISHADYNITCMICLKVNPSSPLSLPWLTLVLPLTQMHTFEKRERWVVGRKKRSQCPQEREYYCQHFLGFTIFNFNARAHAAYMRKDMIWYRGLKNGIKAALSAREFAIDRYTICTNIALNRK